MLGFLRSLMMNQPVLFIIPGACALGSQITLEWIKEPYQIGLTTPEIRAGKEFRKVNPAGKVGALKDGDQVVAENLAILLYLADKYQDKNIAPLPNTGGRARIYQWLSYLSSTLHPAFGQVSFPQRFIAPEHTEQFKRLALERLVAVLGFIDNSFNVDGLLVGSKPTIVEAQAYGLLRWIKGFHGSTPVVSIDDFSGIKEFLHLMEKDQAVRNALAIESNHVESVENSKFSGYFQFS